ncbi:unnamed protein product [Prorocentrum cordatum]|uniref:Uncharacterized protein n=1 Tax=Prorocentrum cordatum TaxID=2364126 RepID=A0ABN9QI02_9DINO|nr:unnamed protein product [Polarella glacialis]
MGGCVQDENALSANAQAATCDAAMAAKPGDEGGLGAVAVLQAPSPCRPSAAAAAGGGGDQAAQHGAARAKLTPSGAELERRYFEARGSEAERGEDQGRAEERGASAARAAEAAGGSGLGGSEALRLLAAGLRGVHTGPAPTGETGASGVEVEGAWAVLAHGQVLGRLATVWSPKPVSAALASCFGEGMGRPSPSHAPLALLRPPPRGPRAARAAELRCGGRAAAPAAAPRSASEPLVRPGPSAMRLPARAGPLESFLTGPVWLRLVSQMPNGGKNCTHSPAVAAPTTDTADDAHAPIDLT